MDGFADVERLISGVPEAMEEVPNQMVRIKIKSKVMFN